MTKFPKNFLWGAASSAYQIEGFSTADGGGQSIWDTFCHTPGKIAYADTGDIACDAGGAELGCPVSAGAVRPARIHHRKRSQLQ